LFATQDPSSRKEARKKEPNRQVMPQNESITRVQLLEFPSKDMSFPKGYSLRRRYNFVYPANHDERHPVRSKPERTRRNEYNAC
jgi:hypothetical protein